MLGCLRRMAGSEPVESTAHLLSFLALIRLAHTAGGQQALVPHLPRVVAAVLHGLDLDRPALRRNCVMVGPMEAPPVPSCAVRP